MFIIEILTGLCCLILIYIFNYFYRKSDDTLKSFDKIIKIKKKNNFDIECSCRTFFIDEEELMGCKYCIYNYIEKTEKKKKNKLKLINQIMMVHNTNLIICCLLTISFFWILICSYKNYMTIYK